MLAVKHNQRSLSHCSFNVAGCLFVMSESFLLQTQHTVSCRCPCKRLVGESYDQATGPFLFVQFASFWPLLSEPQKKTPSQSAIRATTVCLLLNKPTVDSPLLIQIRQENVRWQWNADSYLCLRLLFFNISQQCPIGFLLDYLSHPIYVKNVCFMSVSF